MRLASARCLSLRQVWRKAEVSIPNALRHPSRFERALGAHLVDFPYWRKAENTIPIRLRVPPAFQATAIPDRLAFHELAEC